MASIDTLNKIEDIRDFMTFRCSKINIEVLDLYDKQGNLYTEIFEERDELYLKNKKNEIEELPFNHKIASAIRGYIYGGK